MPSATFRFGTNSQHECKVDLSPIGHERFYVDGQLIQKHWSMRFNGTREFSAYGHQIQVVADVQINRLYITAIVDGVVITHDLFHELNEKTKRTESFFLSKTYFYFLIILFFVSFFAFFIYERMK